MCLGIECYRTCPGGSWNIFAHELARCRLSYQSQGSRAVCAEGDPGYRVERIPIRSAVRDRRRDDSTSICVDDSHHSVSAACKQNTMYTIHREAARFLARCKRIAVEYREFCSVELDNHTLVFDIDEDVAHAIGDACFRFPAQRKGSGNRVTNSIDRRGILTAAVESEDALCRRIIQNTVGISARNVDDFCSRQRHKIEGCDSRIATVARKSLVQIVRERHAVNSRCVLQLTNKLAGIGVNYLYPRRACYEDATPRCVERYVVPTAVAPNRNPSRDVVRAGYRLCPYRLYSQN